MLYLYHPWRSGISGTEKKEEEITTPNKVNSYLTYDLECDSMNLIL